MAVGLVFVITFLAYFSLFSIEASLIALTSWTLGQVLTSLSVGSLPKDCLADDSLAIEPQQEVQPNTTYHPHMW